MSKKPNAAALLLALQGGNPEDEAPPARVIPQLTAVPTVAAATPETAQPESRSEPRQALKAVKAPARGKLKAPRSELKHIGGYLDDETVEKVALLRIRLKLENSGLLKLAIDDLYRKHTAKRAFGDA